jgi:hypothetical protein
MYEGTSIESPIICFYWKYYPGIGKEKKSFLLKKTDPTFCTPFLFIKYSKTTHWKHHIHGSPVLGDH